MKFTLAWLYEHLATKEDLDGLLALMLKAGLEVESVDDPAKRLAAFTVCKVRDAQPHPDADKLRVCTVDTIDGEKQIVCGAPNAKAGMSAIYAPLGAYIPGADFALDKKPRKIRGVESHGMMCSAKELEAGEDHDGIIELTEFFEIGTPAAEALGCGDIVIDFEVTPNRGDWLGVKGIARDLAAAGAGRLLEKDVKKVSGSFECPVEIRLEAKEACPIFAGAVIAGVKNGPSPDWMQQRLKAVGLQPRSLLVDVTNYVSLDRARPLHVYDADKLTGAVVARLGKAGEKLEALDGKTYEITPDMCVIADDSGAIGLGGVMGGESTAVSDETTTVFIESAWFDPLRTARTGRATGIVSDARYRFERGVDTGSCEEGLNLAIQLITEYGGGRVSRRKIAGDAPGRLEKAAFHTADVKRLTGLEVKPADMRKMLKSLGFEIEESGKTWYLTPPGWRFDVACSADAVEEIARLVGYDELPQASLPEPQGGRRAITTPMQNLVRKGRRVMAARGFTEAVTWSFMSKTHAALFTQIDPALVIANPVASELDYMRPTILGNLALAAQRAFDHGVRGARLFEAGPIYLGDEPGDQRDVIAAIVGPCKQRHWQGPPDDYDAYSAKADLFALLDAMGHAPAKFQISSPQVSHFHPGQGAALKLGPKVTVAHFGALHPGTLKSLRADGPLYGFELSLDALPAAKDGRGKTKSKLERSELSPIRRDLAFVVKEDVPAGDIVRLARTADKKMVQSASIFDVYRGTGIDGGHKSVAIEVTLQPRTKLTDEDIQSVMNKIVASVAKGTGGTLRG